MPVFDRYMIRNLFIACVFITLTLTVVIFLTQSLRFLELVIEAGASSSAFWVLTFLALPRFFEVIVPIALVAAVLFTYSRMLSDSEIIVMRTSGASPFALARPAIVLSLLVTVFLIVMTMWVAPKSLSTMQEMRQEVKAQFSALLFREGVFNQVGDGLTLYIRDKGNDGEMRGIMIHDARDADTNPSTIIAKRGSLQIDDGGYEVIVYEGSRQEFDQNRNVMSRLDFERYGIDLPDSDPVRQRWAQPDERTIFELLKPDMTNERDVRNLREFNLELHKRVLSPLMAVSFTVIGCVALLLGPINRRGNVKRILTAVVLVVVLQGLFISLYNVARQNDAGLYMLYVVVFAPLLSGLFLLSPLSETFRRRVFFPKAEQSV